MSLRRPGSIIAIALLLVICLLSSACSLFPSSPSTLTPHRGGAVVFGIQLELNSLLPMQEVSSFASMVDQCIWAPLWYGDPEGILHPGIAREVPSTINGDISADLKTWTIRLRPNLKWSDGVPLTAADVAYSLNTYADPRYANTVGFPLHSPTDPIDFLGATAVDPTTVVFTLAHPYVAMSAILADGAGAPIPQHVFGAITLGDTSWWSQQRFLPTVVSGPFTVKDHVQANHLTLVHNPHYYQGPEKPYLDSITFKIIGTQAGILAALQAGTIDTAWYLDVTKLDSYRALLGYSTFVDPHPVGSELLAFQLTNPILADRAVRQALTMSFDPRQLITQVWHGAAALTCDDSAGTFAHEPALTCYPQDPAGARQLLDRDGWILGADGFRHKHGRLLELRFSTTESHPYRLQTEALAQAAWAAIGIKLIVKNYPDFQFLGQVLSNGSFDIAEFSPGALGYDPDDHYLFMCNQTADKGGENFMHYCNLAVDQAEIVQQKTANIATRQVAFHTIHVAILHDLPVMYLYSDADIAVYRNTLHNYMPSPEGPVATWNVWNWYLA